MGKEMKVIKVVITIIDFDNVGINAVKEIVENAVYPNRCISPTVISIEERDIGEWTDEHPLNKVDQYQEEIERIFRE
jgi:hypothetical protein